MAELKEQVSQFLYNNFIDFDRDVGVKIQDYTFNPSFIIRKSHIIIDCFVRANNQDAEYEKRKRLYESDGVKYVTLDLSNVAYQNVSHVLSQELPKLGCTI
ncbi:hypothetical protein JW711_02835 [Candidatus Woesearchaeota archaeon]|nr:hypothetical protein [Candidatus Woesearchaeota archaeon]